MEQASQENENVELREVTADDDEDSLFGIEEDVFDGEDELFKIDLSEVGDISGGKTEEHRNTL